MSPSELLKAAERVRIASEGESMQELIEQMMREMPAIPAYPSPPLHPVIYQPRRDCGCNWYGACLNTACPRRAQVTYGVGWPE